MEYTHQIIMPIVSSSGDCIGSIVLISKESEMLSEGDEKILKIAANFLGKQVQENIKKTLIGFFFIYKKLN